MPAFCSQNEAAVKRLSVRLKQVKQAVTGLKDTLIRHGGSWSQQTQQVNALFNKQTETSEAISRVAVNYEDFRKEQARSREATKEL
jgi:O-glycosyl hydrolase